MRIRGADSGRWIGALGLLALAVLSGAPGSAAEHDVRAKAVVLAELSGTAWAVEDLGGRGVVDHVRSTLGFRRDGDGGVYGSGGCNRYTGQVARESGRLRFGPLASTRRMCPAAVMDQEQRFFAALAQTASFGRRGAVLVALDADGAELMNLTALEGDA